MRLLRLICSCLQVLKLQDGRLKRTRSLEFKALEHFPGPLMLFKLLLLILILENKFYFRKQKHKYISLTDKAEYKCTLYSLLTHLPYTVIPQLPKIPLLKRLSNRLQVFKIHITQMFNKYSMNLY